jgi:hypothetical protein
MVRYWSNLAGACRPTVGTFKLTPKHNEVGTDRWETYKLSWTHPERWRDLRTLELRFRDGDQILFRVRWNEEQNTLALFDPQTESWGADQTPGSKTILETSPAGLDLHRSLVRAQTIREVRLWLTILLKPVTAGRAASIEVLSTDDFDTVQDWEEAGSVEIEDD